MAIEDIDIALNYLGETRSNPNTLVYGKNEQELGPGDIIRQVNDGAHLTLRTCPWVAEPQRVVSMHKNGNGRVHASVTYLEGGIQKYYELAEDGLSIHISDSGHYYLIARCEGDDPHTPIHFSARASELLVSPPSNGNDYEI